ncbi:unnamed protein product [Chrysoparadoxa australica]
MNPDLAHERSQSRVSVPSLTHLLDGDSTGAATAARRKLETLVEGDPVLGAGSVNSSVGAVPDIYLSRPERYVRALEKSRRFCELVAQGHDPEALLVAVNASLPILLHSLMFVPAIKALYTPQQHAKWLDRCEDMSVIGCFAQTELGHGSNIRALETTATYIQESDEFEIHSPTLTSTKWWPGTLGRTANHAMVIAQLYTRGKCHGIHNFIVPIRCPHNHTPLEGITAGDIGPKIGFNTMDNGFCRFNHVRIPRENMAMRYNQVNRNGVYSKLQGGGNADKIAYIPMMQVRNYIVVSAGHSLASACTTAIRYSAVRRQGFDERGGERQVLDYTIQLHRLLPLLSCAYAFHFTGVAMEKQLQLLESGGAGSEEHVNAAMAYFHASSSGLKSLSSTITADGIEDCRRSCGGHGYLLSSGLPEKLGDYLQTVTVEGENHMLTQQVVRFLLKALVKAGDDAGDVSYLAKSSGGASSSKSTARCKADVRTDSFLLEAFEHRARRMIVGIACQLKELQAAGSSKAEAWNMCLIEIYRTSRAHCLLVVLKRFVEALEQEDIGGAAQQALVRLKALFGLYWIEKDMGDFSEDGYLSPAQCQWVRTEVVSLLQELRPDAVKLVDAWDISDFQLNSALGRKDGMVYTKLYQLAQAQYNPLNASDPVEGYQAHLRHIIVGKARL